MRSHPATTPSAALGLPAGAVAAAGCTLLLVRPQLLRASSNPTATIVVLFAALLLVGLAWPVEHEPAVAARTTALVVGLGIVAFALVHLTVYGAWVLPIDLAAGLVLGWQRWATGSWRAPAVTHAFANLLVVI